MNPHDERAKIEGLLQWLHPDNTDLTLPVDKIQTILQKVSIQVLLDIRDTMYQIAQNQGIDKWGPKIAIEQQSGAKTTKAEADSEPKKPVVSVIGNKE